MANYDWCKKYESEISESVFQKEFMQIPPLNKHNGMVDALRYSFLPEKTGAEKMEKLLLGKPVIVDKPVQIVPKVQCIKPMNMIKLNPGV